MPHPGDHPAPGPSRRRAAAEHIVRRLAEAGHVAYFAGGCVRDALMGAEPADYDVATDATPQQVTAIFHHAHLVGQAFGVVMVRQLGEWVEVATFRKDVGYSDHRHPDRVEFTDAEHDAQRRDFTINGLFYDPIADRVIDYVDGRADIERRIVRAIGRPGDRFGEDYLRMLRAVRFAARLGFELDPATEEAVRAHAHQLAGISRERIGAEVELMMGNRSRAKAAHLMHELRLDAPALDMISVDREPILLGAIGREAGRDLAVPYPAALAAWALDRHLEPHQPRTRKALLDALDRLKAVQIVRKWRAALVLSNDVRDAVRGLLTTLADVFRWPELDTAGRKRLMARDDWAWLRRLAHALAAGMDAGAWDAAAFDAQAAALDAEGVAPTPLITGDDLIAAGHAPGPAFKRVLFDVYDAQLNGTITTREAALALAARLAHP